MNRVWILVFVAVVAVASRGVALQKTPPGLLPYAPSRLEWAALDLQASYGQTTMTHESPLSVTYYATGDGVTVRCILYYTDDLQAAVVNVTRENAKAVFAKYAAQKGWPWLRLEFIEKSAGRSWPGN